MDIREIINRVEELEPKARDKKQYELDRDCNAISKIFLRKVFRYLMDKIGSLQQENRKVQHNRLPV